MYSWRKNTLGNMFKASLDYLTSDNSHMMKNTEWGSVAYLSHSIYGINREIERNDYLHIKLTRIWKISEGSVLKALDLNNTWNGG